MAVIDISVAMRHCRAEDADQEHVQLLLDAAEESASAFLNRSFYVDPEALAVAVLDGSAGEDPLVINKSITAACLLILGHLYANREDVIVGTSGTILPMGARSLLAPFRVDLGV
ncbi:head-tail connector protein [Pseudomonas sp. GD03842]|uniref:head-tail connector protein n=1 Tax=Pseudomonas sp. GD03842 TaxID=2975385 RepID=UPI00244C143B|nr:head-tail connector protein [Pseudomonas sp. GD03842]MDH0745736.1 head-tail connector protein [Pseudomonas sp. GD03842]